MKKCGARPIGRFAQVLPLLACAITLFGSVEVGLAAEKDAPLESILRKLDFAKVALRVMTQPQFEKAVHERALARLSKVGLKPVDPSYHGPVEAVLVLTINPIPLEGVCAGKILYDTKLELEDDVSIKRDPYFVLPRVTWSYAPGHPDVVEKVSLESLLSDVDRYITQFIVAYGYGDKLFRSPVRQ